MVEGPEGHSGKGFEHLFGAAKRSLARYSVGLCTKYGWMARFCSSTNLQREKLIKKMERRNLFKFGLMEGKVHHKDGETECVIVLIGRGKDDQKDRETESA